MNNKKLVCILMFFIVAAKSTHNGQTDRLSNNLQQIGQMRTQQELLKLTKRLIINAIRGNDPNQIKEVENTIAEINSFELLNPIIKEVLEAFTNSTITEDQEDLQALQAIQKRRQELQQASTATSPAPTADTQRANPSGNLAAGESTVSTFPQVPVPSSLPSTESAGPDQDGENRQAQLVNKKSSNSDLDGADAGATQPTITRPQSSLSDGTAKPELSKQNSSESLGSVPEKGKPSIPPSLTVTMPGKSQSQSEIPAQQILELTYADKDGKLMQGDQTIFDPRNPSYSEYNTGRIFKIQYKSLELKSEIQERTCSIDGQQKKYKYASFKKISVGATSPTEDDYTQIGRAFAYLNESIKQDSADLNTQAYCMCEGLEQSIKSIKSLQDRSQNLGIVSGITRSLVGYLRYYGYTAQLDQDTQKIFNTLFAAKEEWLKGVLSGNMAGESGQSQTLNNLGLTKLIHTLKEYNTVEVEV